MPLTAIQQENPCKIIMSTQNHGDKSFTAPVFEQMKTIAQTEFVSKKAEEAQHTGKGMESFPLTVYNQMIEYCLTNEKIRDAMFLILMANYGMRCSDMRRLRFAHIFDSNGNFRESFTLPNGEQKTKKQVIYYNNEATVWIISMYLNLPENKRKTANDFLFTSESGNAVRSTLRDIEANDIYDIQIEAAEKELKSITDQKSKLLKLCTKGIVSDEEFLSENQNLTAKKSELENKISTLKAEKSVYISPTPDAEKIYIQKPITKTAAQDIVKNTLEKIGIYAANRKDKKQAQNFDGKLNTHSLRKTFSDWFYYTGVWLKESRELNLDTEILKLLQEKFMHSSMSVTNRYNKVMEENFRIICQNMNIGLEVLEKYE